MTAFLISTQAYDRTAASTFEARASAGLGADTRITGGAWSGGAAFPSLLTGLPDVTEALPLLAGSSAAIVAGGIVPAFGQVTLALPEDATQAAQWRRAIWEGWTVTIWRGSGNALAGYAVWMTADIAAATIQDEQLVLSLSPAIGALEATVPVATYAGTGGLEGGSDLKGQPVVTILGLAENYEPDLVDPATNLYRLNAGAVNLVTGVWDRLRALTFYGDYASVAALPTTATIPDGMYATALAAGAMRLGADPGDRGAITVSARDAADTRVGEVFRRAAQLKLASGAIDSAAIAALNSAYPATAGLALKGTARLRDLLDQLAISAEAVWRWTAAGQLTIARVTDTVGADLSPALVASPRPARRLAHVPPSRLDLGWRRSWKVFDVKDVGDFGFTDQGDLATADTVDFATQVSGGAKPENNATASKPYDPLNRNGSFEQVDGAAIVGWETDIGTAVTQVTGNAKLGQRVARLVGATQILGDPMPVAPGQKLSLASGFLTTVNDTAGANPGTAYWYLGLHLAQDYAGTWVSDEDVYPLLYAGHYTVADGYRAVSASYTIPATIAGGAKVPRFARPAISFEGGDAASDAQGYVDYFQITPFEPGATVGAPAGTTVAGRDASTVAATVQTDGTIATDKVVSASIIANAVTDPPVAYVTTATVAKTGTGWQDLTNFKIAVSALAATHIVALTATTAARWTSGVTNWSRFRLVWRAAGGAANSGTQIGRDQFIIAGSDGDTPVVFADQLTGLTGDIEIWLQVNPQPIGIAPGITPGITAAGVNLQGVRTKK